MFTFLTLLLWHLAILRLADANYGPGALFHLIQELAEASFVPGAFVLGALGGRIAQDEVQDLGHHNTFEESRNTRTN